MDMTKLSKTSFVLIDNQEINIGKFVLKLVNLPANVMLDFFNEIGLMIPRELRIRALRTVLNPVVNNHQMVVQSLTDEVQYRLGWYDNFSETQLVNLLPLFNNDELVQSYLAELWLELLTYMVSKKVSESDTIKLYELAEKYLYEPFFDYAGFNKTINPLFYDNPNEIDGLTVDKFRPVLFKSSTTVEIRDIGEKYGVKVPRRIKKQELVDIIKQELRDRKILTPEEEAKIDKLSVIPLQRYAIDHDVKASIELKKEEIIEYIIKNAKETKENYFVPEHPGIYESIQSSKDSKVKDEVLEPKVELEEVIKPTQELSPLEESLLGSDAELLEKIVDLELENRRLKEELKGLKELDHETYEDEISLEGTQHVHEHYHYHYNMNDTDECECSKDHDCKCHEDHECQCHGDHDHDHDHDHHHDDLVDINLADLEEKEPIILFPFKTTVTQKQFIQIKKNEVKLINNKKRKLNKLEPVPVSFIDSE